MTAPIPQDQLDTALALLAQAAQEQASGASARATISTARAQVHALLAVATLLVEQNALLAPPEPEPTPEPTPEPEPEPEVPVDAELSV